MFVDQSYWQGAIAAKPSATYRGYLLGGLCWFAIPFTMATTMGLGARALDLPISRAEASKGLVPPALAVHLMGQGGAFLMTLQLFMVRGGVLAGYDQQRKVVKHQLTLRIGTRSSTAYVLRKRGAPKLAVRLGTTQQLLL